MSLLFEDETRKVGRRGRFRWYLPVVCPHCEKPMGLWRTVRQYSLTRCPSCRRHLTVDFSLLLVLVVVVPIVGFGAGPLLRWVGGGDAGFLVQAVGIVAIVYLIFVLIWLTIRLESVDESEEPPE